MVDIFIKPSCKLTNDRTVDHCPMNRFLFLLICFTSPCYCQEFNLKLDTVPVDPDSYLGEYQLRKTYEVGGEGWKLEKDQKLGHIFYGDMPGSRFVNSGSWKVKGDSLIFL